MFWFISDFHYAWSIIPGFTFVTLHSMIRGGVSYFESQVKINMWLCGCVYSTCGKSFYAGILSHPRKKKKKNWWKTFQCAPWHNPPHSSWFTSSPLKHNSMTALWKTLLVSTSHDTIMDTEPKLFRDNAVELLKPSGKFYSVLHLEEDSEASDVL